MVSLFDVIHSLDLQTFDWCLKRKHRQLFVGLSRWISRTADGHLYAITGIICIALAQWQLVKVLSLGFVLERSAYFILKNKLKRNRPQQTIPGFQSVIQPSDQFSFPSGHTSAAFLMAGIIGALFTFVIVPLVIWATWVGISRVMLGVHFPTDSLAGAALGFTISQLSLSLIVF
ncbi:MAG: phosphatase PAP2 family protein [Pseudomonadota bacterium]